MLTMEDVWGNADDSSSGMIVARSGKICPIWGDLIPHKSATFICDENVYDEVNKWISYVQGQGYSKMKKLTDGKIALRSNYSALLW